MQTYSALRLVSIVYRIVAIVVFATALLTGIADMVVPTIADYLEHSQVIYRPALTSFGIVIIVSGVVSAVSLYAVGQFIMLLIDMEQNTRQNAQLTQMLIKHLRGVQKLKTPAAQEEFDLDF